MDKTSTALAQQLFFQLQFSLFSPSLKTINFAFVFFLLICPFCFVSWFVILIEIFSARLFSSLHWYQLHDWRKKNDLCLYNLPLPLILSVLKRSPYPKLGDLFPNVEPSSVLNSDGVGRETDGNLRSLPNEYFCLEVEKLTLSWTME